ncbi:sporulation protein [Bacillus sp. NSP9.1]|uniref:sporulation protein n=1 Tax=Bacillus sp. NSP9.1 TaxID=1071078 RepID=UPI000427E2F5|nr:sporulation protein [Bacillus sp. NSP9.1]QHZ45967.1 sporulation protein [Bacillus sp. NSP9.1]
MSFLKKLAASAGIGSAKVNTILDKSAYRPGERVSGTVHVKGGNVEQHIRYIDLLLETEYLVVKKDEKHWKNATIESHRVTDAFTIKTGEEREFSFSFILPLDTPITIKGAKVFLLTDLDIQGGIDKSDDDHLFVKPHPWVHSILETVESLGFRLHEADCEQASYFRKRLPFVQEFEFVPVTPHYRQLLDEVELVFLVQEDGVDVIIEVDRRARGMRGWLEEMYNGDEEVCRLHFDESELKDKGELAEVLKDIIEQCAK